MSTSPPTDPTTTKDDSDDSGGLLGPLSVQDVVIIGGIALVVVLIMILCIIGFCCWKKRRNLQRGRNLKHALAELHGVKNGNDQQKAQPNRVNSRNDLQPGAPDPGDGRKKSTGEPPKVHAYRPPANEDIPGSEGNYALNGATPKHYSNMESTSMNATPIHSQTAQTRKAETNQFHRIDSRSAIDSPDMRPSYPPKKPLPPRDSQSLVEIEVEVAVRGDDRNHKPHEVDSMGAILRSIDTSQDSPDTPPGQKQRHNYAPDEPFNIPEQTRPKPYNSQESHRAQQQQQPSPYRPQPYQTPPPANNQQRPQPHRTHSPRHSKRPQGREQPRQSQQPRPQPNPAQQQRQTRPQPRAQPYTQPRPQPRQQPRPTQPLPAVSAFAAAKPLVATEKESILLDMGVDELKALKSSQTATQQLASVMSLTGEKRTGPTVREALASAAQQADAIERKIDQKQQGSQYQRFMSDGSAVNMRRQNQQQQQSYQQPQRHTMHHGDDRRQGDARQSRHARPHRQKKKKKKSRIPPPPKAPPPEYIDGYDSDESMYAPQFQNRSQRQFSLDDSSVRNSSRDMRSAFEQLKNEKSGIHRRSKKRLHEKRQIGLPDTEGELTEKQFYQKYWIEAGKLGEGSFARVRKITRKHDRRPFALKVIKKAGKSKEDLDALQKEIDILAKLHHKNVVKLTDWVYTKKRIYMIVEFCDGGDVFERILKLKSFSEFEASHVIAQVAEGLEHIHEKGIVHRDLKPDNLMYLTSDPQSAVKIIDFGLAGDASGHPLTTPCGTAHYVAPEVLSSKPYGTKADMWSLGVIIYMLLCGFPPFFDATGNQKRLYKLIKSGRFRFPSPYWDYISEQAKDLVRGLLTKDPNQRLSAAEVLSHPWIGGKAKKKEIGDIYMEQMKHFQSSRHFTNMKLGEEEKHKPKTPVKMFAQEKYAYRYDDNN